ncbi:MAG: SPOR domain-containing protein [Candidatus Acidiferrales bacterium]
MGNKRSDRVLESRHLVGLFLGVVLLCGVFFTLGYVMGRTQYDTSVHASDVSPLHAAASPRNSAKSSADKSPAAPAASEWDFYAKKANSEGLEAAPKPPASRGAAAAGTPRMEETRNEPKLPSHVRAPHMLKNAIVLQVAALRHQGDALALADAIQQKHFPSFVVAPATDAYYRVQVGPYSSQAAAEKAKRELDHQGFKSIIKR